MFSKEIERFLEYFSKNEAGRKGVACTVIGPGNYVICYKDDKDQTFPWVSGFETAKDAEVFKYYMSSRLKEKEAIQKQPDDPMAAIMEMMKTGGPGKKGPTAESLVVMSYCPAPSIAVLDKLEQMFNDHRV